MLRRQLDSFSGTIFDVAIIGGGITGACIARDAARRGLRVALVERRDFSGGTSAATSHMVHGGLRYLESMQIGVVRESLRERRTWERIAPHMVRPQLFIVPSHSRGNDFRLRVGVKLYDFLSFDRNDLEDTAQHIPASRRISAEDAVTMEPVLEGRHPHGAVVYGDCVMFSPERLALECLIDATDHSATIANYAEADTLGRDSAGRVVVGVRDVVSGERFEIRARIVINAAGPWADRLSSLEREGAPARLLRSKGIHMVVRSVTSTYALTVPHRGRHFFVIPWRGHSLIGTTDTPYDGEPDDVAVTAEDLASFLAFVNEALPGVRLEAADVAYAYAGLRPLIVQPGVDSYRASRHSEIVDHSADGGLPMLSVIGGKWTTSRAVAERCVDLVARRSGIGTKKCDTATARLPGAASGRADATIDTLAARYAHLQRASIASAVQTFGSQATRVLDLAAPGSEFAQPVSDKRPNTLAEVLYVVRNEMALSLDDVLFRRTGIGTLGTPGRVAVERIARVMAQEMGWSTDEMQEQMLAVSRRFRTA